MEVLEGGVPQAWREAVRDEAASWLSRHAACCDGFYEMMRYQLDTSSGSGMFCASLCLQACQAAGGSWRSAVRAAVALELLFHWFRIHQEIERHTSIPGTDAVWQRWGEAQAINTGDGLFALALVIALHASDVAETALLLSRELCNASLMFAEEQQLDLDETGQRSTTDCERVAVRQMGALGGVSAWAGAVMAGSRKERQQALRAFGAELGTAWQIADDRASSISKDASRHHVDHAVAILDGKELPAEGREQLEAFARGLFT